MKYYFLQFKKKIQISFLLFSLLFTSLSSFAYTNETLDNSNLNIESGLNHDSEQKEIAEKVAMPIVENYRFRFFADLSHYRYVEPSYISHTGLLFGLAMDWNYLTSYFKGEIANQLQVGRLDYDGSICDIKTEQCSDLKAKTHLVIFKVAHHFKFELNSLNYIYLGLGYKYLYDKGEGLGFYGRLGQYIYLPIGVQIQLPKWGSLEKWGIEVEYAPTLVGGIDSFMSEVNSTYSNLRFDQNKANSYKMILSYQPKIRFFNLSNDWIIQFYFEKWDIEKSNKSELYINNERSGKFFIEPANYSENTGLRLGIHY